MSLPWPDCHNARDLGGLRLAAGGRIRTGGLIRSDNLDRLTSAGLAAVRSARVSRIIDLRTAGELRWRPSPFAAEPTYVHRPYIDEVADLQRDPVAEATKSATYRGGLGRTAGASRPRSRLSRRRRQARWSCTATPVATVPAS
jgi:protein tyrosine/serine phosphatase